MKLSLALPVLLLAESTSAFSVAPSASAAATTSVSTSTALFGYLDNLGAIPPPEEEKIDDSYEATKMKKEDVKDYSPGNWEGYVDFGDEFDGGDGQMGVAGDGKKSLEKFDMSQMAKSKTMSAKNAWGKSTGYAETLREKGMDTARAQQLENWNNQQELRRQRDQQRYMTEQYDKPTEDENWRNLKSFGVERNQDFDLDSAFGAVEPGELEGTIELKAGLSGPMATHEFNLRNEYMGFADFRAAFTAETGPQWTIEPKEGSLSRKEDTPFLLRFRPQSPGVCEGYLVIETEDFKKTWKLVGGTA